MSVHFGFSWSFVLTKTETALSDNIQNSKNTIFDCNWGNFFCFVQKTNYSDIHWTHARMRTHTRVPVCRRLENDCVYMFVYMSLVWAWAGLKRHTITCISITLLNEKKKKSHSLSVGKKKKKKKFFFLAIRTLVEIFLAQHFKMEKVQTLEVQNNLIQYTCLIMQLKGSAFGQKWQGKTSNIIIFHYACGSLCLSLCLWKSVIMSEVIGHHVRSHILA